MWATYHYKNVKDILVHIKTKDARIDFRWQHNEDMKRRADK